MVITLFFLPSGINILFLLFEFHKVKVSSRHITRITTQVPTPAALATSKMNTKDRRQKPIEDENPKRKIRFRSRSQVWAEEDNRHLNSEASGINLAVAPSPHIVALAKQSVLAKKRLLDKHTLNHIVA